jgi:metallo-beta-lactamase class B
LPQPAQRPNRYTGNLQENAFIAMTIRTRILLAFLAVLPLAGPARAQSYGHNNPEWTTPIAPFRIADNLYYVGSRDLATFLIVTPKGDILINSGLTTSPPLIVKSISQLGFSIRDVKILLISHAHFDHDAGSAELKRLSHAEYMVMEGDVANVRSGGATDFAYPGDRYPSTMVDRILHDGDQVALGGVVLTAHKTPGHTQGCTTWTMKVVSGGKPRDVVIVGSWNVSGDFRLVDRPGHPASYPGIAADYERGFADLAALPCDIFLGAHGAYFNMLKKLARAQAGEGDAVWIDPDGYRKALAEKHQAFETELKRQEGAAAAVNP